MGGLPLKHVFGSDFHVRALEDDLTVPAGKPRYSRSMAKGGLSNVWGAAVLPYSVDDLKDWPISPSDLSASYQSVIKAMTVYGGRDDLERFFPLYGDVKDLKQSRQAAALLADLTRERARLEGEQIYFGKARLALRDGCVECGLCMHGCPHDLIYSTRHTLREIESHPKFKYESGVIVDRVHESSDGVVILGRRVSDRSAVSFKGKKAFVACGVINTLKIVLNSIEAGDRRVSIKTSQHFILPMLRSVPAPDVVNEPLHTLSQVFLELFEQDSQSNCHLQIYSYNDLYRTLFVETAGAFYPLIRGAVERWFLPRFLIAQGYLNSAFSPTLEAWLNPRSGKLHIDAHANPRTRPLIRRLMKRLASVAPAIQTRPLPMFMKLSEAGVGAHIGANFPMKREPGPMETDILGRLPQWKNIHIVDSSVFTDIPPSTVTLTAMANAHRIASNA